jgi:hypothetical protein
MAESESDESLVLEIANEEPATVFMNGILPLVRSESPLSHSEAAGMIRNLAARYDLIRFFNLSTFDNLRTVVSQAHPAAAEVRRSIAQEVSELNCRQPPSRYPLPQRRGWFRLLLELGLDPDETTTKWVLSCFTHADDGSRSPPSFYADKRSIRFLVRRWLPNPHPGKQARALALLSTLSADPALRKTALDAGLLEHLRLFLGHPNSDVQMYAAMAVENLLLQGTPSQLFIHAGLIPILLTFSANEDKMLRRTANDIVAYLMCSEDKDQICYLVNEGALDFFVERIRPEDRILDLLFSLESVLEIGQTIRDTEGLPTNPFVDALRANGGIERIGQMMSWCWDQEISLLTDMFNRFFY